MHAFKIVKFGFSLDTCAQKVFSEVFFDLSKPSKKQEHCRNCNWKPRARRVFGLFRLLPGFCALLGYSMYVRALTNVPTKETEEFVPFNQALITWKNEWCWHATHKLNLYERFHLWLYCLAGWALNVACWTWHLTDTCAGSNLKCSPIPIRRYTFVSEFFQKCFSTSKGG